MEKNSNLNTELTYEFLQKLMASLNSSHHLPEAMQATFNFLSDYLPIDAISLHRFLPQYHSVHLDFLLTHEKYYELNILMPTSSAHIEALGKHELIGNLDYGQTWLPKSLASEFGRFLADFIPNIDRTYLVMILSAGDEVVGHFALIGNTRNCFTKEHEKLVRIMQDSLGLAMKNLLQHRKIETLKQQLENQTKQTKNNNANQDTLIIGKNTKFTSILQMVEQLAHSDAPVLIMGETGTGKELIANKVQELSTRKHKPYLKINCGAIPESLIDSELFGYQKGAFTGALTDRAGVFERASGGTLFLDEIGELSLQSQVRLLRVIQDNEVTRVGGNTVITVNVRIIAATNQLLVKMIDKGLFRSDLYHRLNVFPLVLPPLRERIDDLPLLIHYFIKEYCKKIDRKSEIELAENSINFLREYAWPGNVRELKNLIERALTLNPNDKLNLAHYLPYINEENKIIDDVDIDIKKIIQKELEHALFLTKSTSEKKDSENNENDVIYALDDVMAHHIKKVLKQCHYKINGKGGAAELLQINPSTLRKRMKKLNIDIDSM